MIAVSTMRVQIYSCLLAFVLGCNVTAEMIHRAVKEKEQLTLSCPHPVEGKVTWSRESTNETKVKLITIDGNGETRHNDPGRRYGSLQDKFKSLYLSKVLLSDSGRYFCNSEPVELTVIPSGTTIQDVKEATNITLTCPDVGGSDRPTWSKETAGKQQPIRPHVSTEGNMLTITRAELRDSGLYSCGGKAAAYLRVSQHDGDKKTTTSPLTSTTTTSPLTSTTTTSPPTTSTTTTSPPTTTSPYLWQMPIRMVFGLLYLTVMINIIVVTVRKGCIMVWS